MASFLFPSPPALAHTNLWVEQPKLHAFAFCGRATVLHSTPVSVFHKGCINQCMFFFLRERIALH